MQHPDCLTLPQLVAKVEELKFQGVATVRHSEITQALDFDSWLNDTDVAYHLEGLATFTLDGEKHRAHAMRLKWQVWLAPIYTKSIVVTSHN